MATWEEIEDVIRTRFESQVQDTTTVATIAGTVYSMDSADNSMSRSSGSFLTDGLSEQYKISVTGFTESGNNTTFRIADATATKLLLTGNTVTTEVAGDSVSIAVRLPVHYDNAPGFRRPPITKRWLWAALTVQIDSNQVSTGGNNRFRHSGLAIVEFFVPEYVGTESVTQLAQTTATAFRTLTASGLTFRTPSMQRIGEDKRNVSMPFYSDEVVAV